MAEYDGSIRINTNINTDGIARGMVEIRQVIERGMSASKPMKNTEQEVKLLGDTMSSTAQKASELKNVMESQKNAQVPTKEYSDLQKEIDSLEKKLLSVYDRQEKFLATGGKEDSSTYQKMVYDAETLEKKLQNAEQAMEVLVSSGKAFTVGTDSDAEYWRQQEENIDRIIARLEEKRQKEAETPPELLQPRIVEMDTGLFQEGQREAQALADTVASVGQNAQESAAKSNEAIASMTQELTELKARQKELESQGQGLGFKEYDANVQRIAEINDALSEYRRGLTDTSSSYMNLKEVAQNTLKMMAKGLVDIPTAIVKAGIKGIILAVRELGNVVQKSAIAPFKLLGATAKKIFSSVGKSSKASNNMLNKGFKNILKYGLGIRSVYMLINKFRTAVKEGFKNLAQVSTPVNESLSMLKSSLTQLKNSLATAFAPILTAIAPMLKMLIDMISQAATYVGMFIATLTGASSFTKAIAVQEDYAASLNKTGSAAKKAAGALAKFDDLDVLSKPSSGGGGAGAGQVPVTDMFEEVQIPDKFKDMAQWVKDMWAESDFTELGSFLGERLKESLDNIPWDSIQERAQKLGASLATLINGAVETDGLGYMLGNTLAQGINTAFNFLNSFVHEIHADSIGKFLAETINGITESIEWDVIYDAFTTGAHKLAELINNFLSPENLNYEAISSTISNFVNTIVDSLYIFITETEWADIGTSFGKALSDAWTGIDWAKAGETLGEYFKAFFDFVGNAIKAVDWQEVGRSVADFIKGIDWAGVAESFFSAIGAALGGLEGFLVGLIEDAWNAVVEWWHGTANEDGMYTVQGFLNGIAEALVNIVGWILEHIYNPFMEGFREAFGIHSPSTVMMEMGTYIIEGLLEGITSLIENVTEIWENMKATALEIWENVKKSLSEKWENMKNTATNIFTSMKESVSKIFDGMWGSIKGIINSILGGVEKMANGVVDAINTVIRALNSLSFDLPTWLPGDLGGKSLSLNISEIPKVNIPRLATGAVIRGGNPFMAILGDQPAGKTNIEAPLSTIEQAVENVISRQGYGRENVPVNINLTWDGETFARLSISDILSELGRQGFNVDVLGVN